MSTNPRSHRDVYAEVTAKLIAAIETSKGEVTLPWRRSGLTLGIPKNAVTGKDYNGINIISLWAAAEANTFRAPLWATYKQWQEIGAQVRGGAKSSPIVFYKDYDAPPNPDDPADDGRRRVARASAVFNADQVDGFSPPVAMPPLPPIERLAVADAFIAAAGATVETGGDRAYYRPATDQIQMPDEELFTGTETMTRQESYYAVLAHEHIHWTGAEHRLNRQLKSRFGDDAYAAEELVAEIGSAFLCAELGITQDTREDHAHYLANWLALLKSDKKAIFTAAAKAAEAVAHLKALQPGAPLMVASAPSPTGAPRQTTAEARI